MCSLLTLWGVRLTTVAKPSLQKLWERCGNTKEQREALKDALPMRCDAAWFRATFLEDSCPPALGPHDDIWPYVKGFNEYDGLATIAAAVVLSPNVFQLFFDPYTCPHTGTHVVGISKDEPGIKDAAKACELLHDLMVNALDVRKPGQQIFYRLDGARPQHPALARTRTPTPHPSSDPPPVAELAPTLTPHQAPPKRSGRWCCGGRCGARVRTAGSRSVRAARACRACRRCRACCAAASPRGQGRRTSARTASRWRGGRVLSSRSTSPKRPSTRCGDSTPPPSRDLAAARSPRPPAGRTSPR